MDTTPESDAARDAVRERCADIARATIPSACSTSPPICPRCGTISPAGSSLAGALPCRIWPCNPSRPPWLPRWTPWWDAWPGAPLVADTERMMREAGLVDIALEPKLEYAQAMACMQHPFYEAITAHLPERTIPVDYITSLDISARKPS
jgi:hypothetical protein